MARRRAAGRRGHLEAPDPAEVLGRLRLTTGRAARVCGVTRRQLCYWTDQGIIDAVPPTPEDEGDHRAYDAAALRKVLLLKQALAQGAGVRRAAKEAQAYLEEAQERAEALRACSPRERQPVLAEQAERLDEMAQRLRRLAGQVGRERLEALAARLEAVGEVCGRILNNGTAMHEDPEACLALGAQLDRLEATVAEIEAGDRA